MDHISISRLKLLLLISSLVTLVFLLLAAFQENLTGQWRTHQQAYRQVLIDRAKTPQAQQSAQAMDIGFKQLFLPRLDRIDRCVTCHISIDDPTQVQAKQPLRAHSGAILTHHPVDKFGCTVCHDGQGRAIEKDAAHGEVEHWSSPLLRGDRVYTSCGRCHYENDLYLPAKPHMPIDQQELAASVPSAQVVHRGKQLVISLGCLGCHRYQGRGGTPGPDITYIGDKTAHDFDFKDFQGEHTASAWVLELLKNPDAVSPGTPMPDFNLSNQQAHDLTMYLLSLQRKNLPATYTPLPSRLSGKPAAGAQLYTMFCSACHGQEGQGVPYFDDRNTNVPALQYLAERLGLYDPEHAQAVVQLLESHTDPITLIEDPPFDADMYEEFLNQLQVMRDVIRSGRQGVKKNPDSPLKPVDMPAWQDTLTNEQVDEVLAYLISLFPWDEE